MRLYEFEAKKVLAQEGIQAPKAYGLLNETDGGALPACPLPVMVKAQVLAGGRGKAGGIRRVTAPDEFEKTLKKIRAIRIGDYRVTQVLVEEAVDYSHELYLGITINPANGRVVIIASGAGGVDIEAVAATRPDAIFRRELDFDAEVLPDAVAAEVAAFLTRGLDVSDAIEGQLADVAARLYAIFQKHDCKLVEINPLLITESGPIAADAKMVLDDNALYRQRELLDDIGVKTKRHDVAEPTARERRAWNAGVPYVDLLPEGAVREAGKVYVGLAAGGAGYGIFSIDEVANIGERYFDGQLVPLNFMDSGGGPSINAVKEMFHLLLDHPLADVIVTSRFGGISSCDIFIRGVVECLRERTVNNAPTLPIYGRMVGTDLAAARAYLETAREETPAELAGLSIVVGNRITMADVIRDGMADFLQKQAGLN